MIRRTKYIGRLSEDTRKVHINSLQALPANVHFIHSNYYDVKNHRCTPLAKTTPGMRAALALVLVENPLHTTADPFDKYVVDVLPAKAEKTQRTQALYVTRIRAAFEHTMLAVLIGLPGICWA